MTRIVCLSDLHGMLPPDVPECDLLLIGGDLTLHHERWEEMKFMRDEFLPWLHRQKAKDHVVIAGNHDFSAMDGDWFDLDMNYVEDRAVELQGHKIYGSPWSNRFGGWAFMAYEPRLAELMSAVPDDTTILITHGPPKGIGDFTKYSNENVGSTAFRETANDLPLLRLHLFGHIHEGRGVYWDTPHVSVNASYVDVTYVPYNEPPVQLVF